MKFLLLLLVLQKETTLTLRFHVRASPLEPEINDIINEMKKMENNSSPLVSRSLVGDVRVVRLHVPSLFRVLSLLQLFFLLQLKSPRLNKG